GQFVAEGGIRGESEVPRIGLDPVIVARQRTLGYGRAIEAILREVPSLELEQIPSSLLNMAGVEASEAAVDEPDGTRLDGGGNEDEEILFNKPANPEQLLIAKRLERHGCVLVQGPPGTGKTHSIANLIGHLLARGQSVLVTSHTTKALRVLREMVDPRVQSLCVSVLDNDSESQTQMEAAISEIAERLNNDAGDLERQAEIMKSSRAELISRLRRLRTRLFEARASEYRQFTIGGTAYSPAQAARIIQEGLGVNDWIPRPVVARRSLPLNDAEVVELYQTNQLITAEDEKEFVSVPPNPEFLMPPHEFAELVENLDALETENNAQQEVLWNDQGTVTEELLTNLIGKAMLAVEPITHGFNSQFKLRLISDGRQGQAYSGAWDELISKMEEVVRYASESRSLVLNYGPAPAAEIPHEQQIRTLEEIIMHLEDGGTLGKRTLLFKGEWKNLIAQSSIDGNRPTELIHFEALLAATHLRRLRTNLVNRWDRQLAPLGVPSARDFGSEPEDTCAQYIEQIRSLLSWQEMTWEPVERGIRELGFDWDQFLRGVQLKPQPNGELLRLADAVQNYLPAVFRMRVVRLQRDDLKRRVAVYRSRIRAKLATGQSADLFGEMLRAVELKDSGAYSKIASRIVELHVRYQTFLRRSQLLARIEPLAPSWAKVIKQRSGVHAGDAPPGDPRKAWLWRQLNDELDEIDEESMAEIQLEIEQGLSDLHRLTSELIETSAWACQIRHTGLKQKQALSGWVQTMHRIGKGTGKRAPALLSQARRLMEDCRSAVPAWIMPLARVVENYQPQSGLFDVVIIDEASQCDVMGLIALYLGKRVIVVGDDEQVSPDAIGDTAQAAQDLINIYLQGIPNAELYDGKLSVYDLAMQSFSGTVCLREHFRCVPEIIGFSNQLSYEGKIKPLRDSTHNPLSPAVIAHYVRQGQSGAKVNVSEAETVAALVLSAIEQPEYEDQTFGVISMVGEDQAALIEQILRSKMEPAEYARRKITCGNAAQFQGDERHVMFLSVVDGPAEGPLSMRQQDLFRKRFNVAASRAQNQLWVVHSLQPAIDLKPGDLRRQLIEYAQNPYAQIESPNGQSNRTESEFERQVMQRLILAGYGVTPQWKIGSYRIDMVVTGGGKRVAIECDGDRWQPLEKIPEDMERQAILERLNWKFVRVRGSQFFRAPDRTMQEIFAKLEFYGVVPEENAEISEPAANGHSTRLVRRAQNLLMEWSRRDAKTLFVAPNQEETYA
ncbi:MAG TPA: AAA domain-containing protein, partial [Blastocatellia bacterium]|nr:AAA domain-containing protein [Blastocatellia bacterium]